MRRGRSGARTKVTDDITAAVAGADFVYTDVWLSMGEPHAEWDDCIDVLLPYQGREIFSQRGLDALEVTDEVFESAASIVFDQAENRLHTIKALMVATVGDHGHEPGEPGGRGSSARER